VEAGAVEPIVSDEPGESRFAIRLGDELVGIAAYHRRPGEIDFTHTEIDPSFEGRGLGGRLIAAALDAARDEGLTVRPFCPFVRGFIDEHRDYLPLVAGSERERFGLPLEA
jgi:uncharacterized protein